MARRSSSRKSRLRARVASVAARGRSLASRARTAAKSSKLVPFVTGAAMDAGGILVGKAIARTVRSKTGQEAGTVIGSLIEAAVGIALGMVVGSKSAAWGNRLAVGGMLAPMETLVQRLNVPLLSSALGDDGYVLTDLGDDVELVNAYDMSATDPAAIGSYVGDSGTVSGYVSGGAGVMGDDYEFGEDQNTSLAGYVAGR